MGRASRGSSRLNIHSYVARPFLSAGTVDWPRAWIYLGLQVAIVTASAVLILRANPALVTARSRIHRDAKRFDKVILRIYVLLLFAVVVVAGLDVVRCHWTAALPFATVYSGVLLNVLTTVPVLWALMVNPFAEPAVRIQKERQHVAITKGPYRFLRHPMYTGLILGSASPPLTLGFGVGPGARTLDHGSISGAHRARRPDAARRVARVCGVCTTDALSARAGNLVAETRFWLTLEKTPEKGAVNRRKSKADRARFLGAAG